MIGKDFIRNVWEGYGNFFELNGIQNTAVINRNITKNKTRFLLKNNARNKYWYFKGAVKFHTGEKAKSGRKRKRGVQVISRTILSNLVPVDFDCKQGWGKQACLETNEQRHVHSII